MCKCTDPSCRSGCGCVKRGIHCAKQCACSGYCRNRPPSPPAAAPSPPAAAAPAPSSPPPATGTLFVVQTAPPYPAAAAPTFSSAIVSAQHVFAPAAAPLYVVHAPSTYPLAAPPAVPNLPPAIVPAQQALATPVPAAAAPPPPPPAPALPQIGGPIAVPQNFEQAAWREFMEAWRQAVVNQNWQPLMRILHPGELRFQVTMQSPGGTFARSSTNTADPHTHFAELQALFLSNGFRLLHPAPTFATSSLNDPFIAYEAQCIYQGYEVPGALRLVLGFVRDQGELRVAFIHIFCQFQ